MTAPIAPIEYGDLTLAFSVFDPPCVFLVNRATGEVRAQVVDRLPTNPRWQETVRSRMERIPAREQTPYVLLRGVR